MITLYIAWSIVLLTVLSIPIWMTSTHAVQSTGIMNTTITVEITDIIEEAEDNKEKLIGEISDVMDQGETKIARLSSNVLVSYQQT